MNFIKFFDLIASFLAVLAGAGLVLCSFPAHARAQAPGVVIEEWMSPDQHSALLEKALRLQKAGKLIPREQLKEQLKSPQPTPVRILPPRNTPLDPSLLAQKAREIRLWIMVLFICPKCTKWHLQDFAAAYAVAPDIIATCEHAFEEALKREAKESLREAYLLLRDSQHRLLGVTRIVAVNSVMDAALLQVDPPHLIPVPLNDQLAPGDPVFCYSDPLGQAGYFSDGIINRFYWNANRQGSIESLEQLSYLRVNFGTDWAPGSSGAPILDQYGNVAGHVSSIQPLSRPSSSPPTSGEGKNDQTLGTPAAFNPPLITVHVGIPARGVLALIRDTNERAGEDAPKPLVLTRDPLLHPRTDASTSLAP